MPSNPSSPRACRTLSAGGDQDLAEITRVRHQRVEDHEDVRDDEHHEDGNQGHHGFLHAAEVQQRQNQHSRDRKAQLVRKPSRGQETEQRVGAAGDRDRDRQHIVDEQRAAGNHADGGREQFAGDEIAAAAGREQFDDLRVTGADDEDRQCGGQTDKNAQIGMRPQREERLLRTVTG